MDFEKSSETPSEIPTEESTEKEKDFYQEVPVEKIIPDIDLEKVESSKKGTEDPNGENLERFIGNDLITDQSFTKITFDELMDYKLAYEDENDERDNFEKLIFEKFKNQIVIDIGTGHEKKGYQLSQLIKAKAYVAVEAFNYKELKYAISNKASAERIRNDFGNNFDSWRKRLGYTEEGMKEYVELYCETEKNKSPYAVIPGDMLTFLKALPDKSVSVMAAGIDANILSDEYRQEIAKEIKRVTNEEGAYLSVNSEICPDMAKVEKCRGLEIYYNEEEK